VCSFSLLPFTLLAKGMGDLGEKTQKRTPPLDCRFVLNIRDVAALRPPAWC
jgi:hypothetical protein